MHVQPYNYCPYCLSAFFGAVVLLSVPGLAGASTPLGAPWVGLLLTPLGSALLRKLLAPARPR